MDPPLFGRRLRPMALVYGLRGLHRARCVCASEVKRESKEPKSAQSRRLAANHGAAARRALTLMALYAPAAAANSVLTAGWGWAKRSNIGSHWLLAATDNFSSWPWFWGIARATRSGLRRGTVSQLVPVDAAQCRRVHRGSNAKGRVPGHHDAEQNENKLGD